MGLVLPPGFIFLIGNEARGFFYAVGFVWAIMIVSGQVHLAYTPGYDGFAPLFAIVFGWLPALVYAVFWLAVYALLTCVKRPSDSNPE